MRRQIKDRDGGGGGRRGIQGVAVCDERHGGEANEGFARAGACREAWKGGALGGARLSAGAAVRVSAPGRPQYDGYLPSSQEPQSTAARQTGELTLPKGSHLSLICHKEGSDSQLSVHRSCR